MQRTVNLFREMFFSLQMASIWSTSSFRKRNVRLMYSSFGILSIVFSVLVLFQSCAASVLDTMQATSAGSMGMIVGILMLAAGIVNIATRNRKGGAIACMLRKEILLP